MSGALFGSPGKMIEFFPWEDKQSVKTQRPISVHTTIGGGSFAFRGKRTRRSWSLKNDELTPEEYRDLELMLYDAHGSGPFWLIDQEARATNSLTPAQSMPGLNGEVPYLTGPASAGPPMRMPEGFTVPTATSTGALVGLRYTVPVIPGQAMTASVYLSKDSTATVRGVKSSGEQVYVSPSLTSVGTGDIRRYFITFTPPNDVDSCFMALTGASIIAAPAVTYGRTLRPWVPGKGCDKAVVSSWGRSFDRMSTLDADRQLVSVSLDVEEVGLGA